MIESSRWIFLSLRIFIIFNSKDLLIDGEVTKSLPSLKLVHVIFRHGHRAPMASYPTDPNPPSSYIEGFKQLSNIGKAQMYNIGLIFRQRYSDFLSSRYVSDEIYIQSSESDRTVMSALSVLAGLYPPSGNEIWNPNITWQPIPVFTVPKEYDHMLSTSTCAKHQKYLKSTEILKVYHVALIKKKKAVINFIAHHGGINGSDIKQLARLIDSLNYQERLQHRMILPSWANKSIIKEANEIADILYTFKRLHGPNKILLGGPFISHVIDQMNKWVENKEYFEGKKFFMYSSHDGIMGPVLAVLGNFHNQRIPVGCSLIIELHEIQKHYFVQMTLLNSSNEAEGGIVLKLPNCTTLCPLSKFTDTLKPELVPSDMNCDLDDVITKEHLKYNDSNSESICSYINVLLLVFILPCFIYNYSLN